jgi:hypothetical protein
VIVFSMAKPLPPEVAPKPHPGHAGRDSAGHEASRWAGQSSAERAALLSLLISAGLQHRCVIS